MRSIEIFWPAVSDVISDIANAQTVTANVSLRLNSNYGISSSAYAKGNTPGNLVPIYADSPRYNIIPNKGTGIQIRGYKMPKGNVRSINITSATGDVSTTFFNVSGFDEYGNAIGVGGTPATILGTGIYFSIISSITPTTTLSAGNTVRVGLGAPGRISLISMDTWNKNNNYNLSYSLLSGTMSLIPYYTVRNINAYRNGVVVNNTGNQSSNPDYFYLLPLANPNFIVSPASATTSPITQTSSFSIVGIPLTGITTNVGSATNGSFSQTILQQGGSV